MTPVQQLNYWSYEKIQYLAELQLIQQNCKGNGYKILSVEGEPICGYIPHESKPLHIYKLKYRNANEITIER